MDSTKQLTRHLVDIVDIARFAPSVHNTQPWLISQTANGLEARIDSRQVLESGDPTGRQTIISLGIFTEALVLGAERFGLDASSVTFQKDKATITFNEKPAIVSSEETIECLRHRFTDRSIYQPAEVPADVISQLQDLPTGPGVSIMATTDRPIIEKVADLTSHGIKLALTNPAFRQELSEHLVLPGSRNKRGIAIESLQLPRVVALSQPAMIKLGIGHNAESQLEKKRWLSASGVVAICGDGDMAAFWFETGRAYLRASLLLEKLGYSQATSAAIVEASNYHEDIEAALGTNQRILALVRFGKGSKRRYYSPRVSAKDLITSNQ